MRARLNGWMVLVLLLGTLGYVIAEEITLTTYYPSPRGMYDELRTRGDVAIGKLDPPNARLEIRGKTAGTADKALYVGNLDGAPRLVVQNDGNVGIGTSNPAQKLTVTGTIESTSGGVKFPDATVQTSAATPHGKQLLTANGAFFVPAAVTTVWVTMSGGGGGGGGDTVPVSIGAGGGGGAHAVIAIPLTVTPGAVYPITVGAGGSGAGGAGGSSSFGGLLTVAGGAGGGGGGGPGGAAGGPGGAAGSRSVASAWGSGGGFGGGSLFGSGGPSGPPYTVAGGAGGAGGGFGAGGGGGGRGDSSPFAVTTGGAGSPGFVLVEW